MQADNINYANILKSNLNDDNFSILNIENASEGDYISLTLIEYDVIDDEYIENFHSGSVAEGLEMPNGTEISGYINLEHTSELCFKIIDDTLNKSYNQLYITGKINSKYLWFFLDKENGDIIERSDKEIIYGQLAFVFDNENDVYASKYSVLMIKNNQ